MEAINFLVHNGNIRSIHHTSVVPPCMQTMLYTAAFNYFAMHRTPAVVQLIVIFVCGSKVLRWRLILVGLTVFLQW